MEENNIEEAVEETQQEDVALPEITHPTAKANSQEVNLRELRSAKARAEKENQELLKRLQQYEEKQESKEKEESYGDDDLVEGKHLKKEVAEVRKQLQEWQQHQAEVTDETRLKSKYNDFDKVVNEDTINKIKEADPEFAETIAYSSSSLYNRGSSMYKRIKDLGIYVEDTHVKEKERAIANASKPRSMNSISPQQGDSPLSMANAFANGLTDDLKKQLYREMIEAAKKS